MLAEALRGREVEVHVAAWSDPTIEWDVIAACVLRSTWDYPERLTEFTRWINTASKKTLLLNDADLVRWNIHKRYLIDLDEAGIPVVPTVHIEKEGRFGPPSPAEETGVRRLGYQTGRGRRVIRGDQSLDG